MFDCNGTFEGCSKGRYGVGYRDEYPSSRRRFVPCILLDRLVLLRAMRRDCGEAGAQRIRFLPYRNPRQPRSVRLGNFAPVEHEVTHVHYINAIRALEVERPTYYVERDLVGALVRTDVPLDLQMQGIHWIYPQLRLYLPKEFLAITRNGDVHREAYRGAEHG